MENFEEFLKYFDENQQKMFNAHENILNILSELPNEMALTLLGDMLAIFCIRADRDITETHMTMAEVGEQVKASGLYNEFKRR